MLTYDKGVRRVAGAQQQERDSRIPVIYICVCVYISRKSSNMSVFSCLHADEAMKVFLDSLKAFFGGGFSVRIVSAVCLCVCA